MTYDNESVLKKLHEVNTYGNWQFVNIDTEYLNKNDFTVKCLKCGKTYYHRSGVKNILSGRSTQCKSCSLIEIAQNKIKKTKEKLRQQDTYGNWKFINIDTEFVSTRDCTVQCLKCNRIFEHFNHYHDIINNKVVKCKYCAAEERGSNLIEKMKKRYKKNPIYGCMKVINIDTEFISSRDCTVQCTKCDSIFHHYTTLTQGKPPTRCINCKSVKTLIGQKFISKDNVNFECIDYKDTILTLKDLSNGFIRTFVNKGERDLSNLDFYSQLSLDEYKELYLSKVLTSREGISVIVQEIESSEADKRIFAKLRNIKTGEIIVRDLRYILTKGFTYNHNPKRLAEVNSISITRDGFMVKVLENSTLHCKLEFKDGVTTEFKTQFYMNHGRCCYSHPNLSKGKYGRYFNYILEGIVFRLDDPKDVYYNCKKDGSDEYEILRPCDIEERGWDTHNGYTIYGKVLDLSTEDNIYYKCQKEGSDKIEVLRLCDMV